MQSVFDVGCLLIVDALERESVQSFLCQRSHGLLGLNFCVHYSVADIFCAIGVHYCLVIFITIIVVYTHESVNLGKDAIYWVGGQYRLNVSCNSWVLHICALLPQGVKCAG